MIEEHRDLDSYRAAMHAITVQFNSRLISVNARKAFVKIFNDRHSSSPHYCCLLYKYPSGDARIVFKLTSEGTLQLQFFAEAFAPQPPPPVGPAGHLQDAAVSPAYSDADYNAVLGLMRAAENGGPLLRDWPVLALVARAFQNRFGIRRALEDGPRHFLRTYPLSWGLAASLVCRRHAHPLWMRMEQGLDDRGRYLPKLKVDEARLAEQALIRRDWREATFSWLVWQARPISSALGGLTTLELCHIAGKPEPAVKDSDSTRPPVPGRSKDSTLSPGPQTTTETKRPKKRPRGTESWLSWLLEPADARRMLALRYKGMQPECFVRDLYQATIDIVSSTKMKGALALVSEYLLANTSELQEPATPDADGPIKLPVSTDNQTSPSEKDPDPIKIDKGSTAGLLVRVFKAAELMYTRDWRVSIEKLLLGYLVYGAGWAYRLPKGLRRELFAVYPLIFSEYLGTDWTEHLVGIIGGSIFGLDLNASQMRAAWVALLRAVHTREAREELVHGAIRNILYTKTKEEGELAWVSERRRNALYYSPLPSYSLHLRYDDRIRELEWIIKQQRERKKHQCQRFAEHYLKTYEPEIAVDENKMKKRIKELTSKPSRSFMHALTQFFSSITGADDDGDDYRD